jgi:hypothetical protein
MSKKKETYIEKRKVCPLRWLVFADKLTLHQVEKVYCIREECAWFLICYNLSNLAEILARSHGKEAI